MSGFALQIVTPDGCMFQGQAQALLVPTTQGYVSIRKGHADYVAALCSGTVSVTSADTVKKAACGGGFISVENGEVRMVATTFDYEEDTEH
ncbi:MAG: F0F1 ATP synthase subunit epsilon [Oscillospiraceae bacterium]|jgi:F-type H+-transporting ATPase subunit epsilon|nr:F0F1 ATP synthase subunit epsilon [Oscillospiraceae bacterium]